MNRLSLLVVFLILTLNYGISDSYLHYGFFGFLLVAYFIRLLVSGKLLLPKATVIDIIPAIFLVVWLYGFILGIVRENQTEGVIRNFAGMIIYFIYYILLSAGVSKLQLFKIVYRASLLNIFVALVGAYDSFSVGNHLGIMTPLGRSRLYYSPSLSVIFFLIAVIEASFLLDRGPRNQHFDEIRGLLPTGFVSRVALFVLATICVVSLSFSKGFFLGYLFLLVSIPLMVIYRRRLSPVIALRLLVSGFILSVIAFGLAGSGVEELFASIFSSQDAANIIRIEQSHYILEDLTFLGKGLGAGLDSGYARDTLLYGFEVSYINIVHKFGVFSLLLIFSYIYTLWAAFKDIRNHVSIVYSAAAIGSMCYLFPALGNPNLMSTVSCLLHSVALYLLRSQATSTRSAGLKSA